MSLSLALTIVSETPLATLVSGHFGVGSRSAQVPAWMWAGSGPAPAPVSARTTRVWSPIGVSVAVPVMPELFWGLSWIVTACWAEAVSGGAPSETSATATSGTIRSCRESRITFTILT